jgi:hypothetical protein
MTAQGHPRTIFKRAIEHGNVTVAQVTARELGRIILDESLALTALVAEKDPGVARGTGCGGRGSRCPDAMKSAQ